MAIAKLLYEALDLLTLPHPGWESPEWLLSWLCPRSGFAPLAYIAADSLGVRPVCFDYHYVEAMVLD